MISKALSFEGLEDEVEEKNISEKDLEDELIQMSYIAKLATLYKKTSDVEDKIHHKKVVNDKDDDEKFNHLEKESNEITKQFSLITNEMLDDDKIQNAKRKAVTHIDDDIVFQMLKKKKDKTVKYDDNIPVDPNDWMSRSYF
jgi:hypothetical protein